MSYFTQYSTELLILLFLIVTFLQSGIDKVVDWKGNVSFIKEHFKNSPLQKSVPALLGIVLILELIASICMVLGIYTLLSSGDNFYALLGVELCSLTLICLLIGQRLAKDYAGAMSLAVYFIITIIGLIVIS
ncbi:MAG: Uncharacterised protein [Flavobacterium sp. SCGC AAA160-P02]|nr:MAG: Uncharacterised protein [Flavobacterium sp. SCGC AAA160-P02]